MEIERLITPVVHVVEVAGVAIIVLGLVLSGIVFAARFGRDDRGWDTAYEDLRRHVARSILLGLEVLVAGDIVRTVAVDPSLASVGVLAGIVAIRTFLSFTLTVEATGRWPWQRDPMGADRGQS